ncbi:MAG: class I SAM-dependent methyltransferase [Saprospiraceae bacterium]|nr:class I SAM-dependent methyltransferase [Saprospiraceae bacterium]
MDLKFTQLRDQQKADWNKFSNGWKKWDNIIMDFLKPIGEQITYALKLKSSDIVLDIAGGTGEPGISIAQFLSEGKVVITDLSENMIEIAKENARKKEIKNVEFLACDVCELPFPDNSFDAISCRFGFMFFPDLHLAAIEIFRVLKPGGRIAVSVWNVPEKNYWLSVMGECIKRNLELPSPSPEAPGIFRCSPSGMMAELFRKVGLKNILEKEVPLILNSETIDNYWNMQIEIAAPVVAALSKVDDSTKKQIKTEVYEAIKQRYTDGSIKLDASSLLVSGEKIN